MEMDFYEDEKINKADKNISAREAFSKLLPFLAEHKKPLIFCLVLLIAATVMSICWPVLMKTSIDVNIANSDYSGLLWTVLFIGLLQGAVLILQYIQQVKLETIGQDVMIKLKKRLFEHILSLDVDFFDRNPVGRLMARIESDTESLRLMFTNTVVMVVGDLILIVGILAVMFFHSWRLSLILVAYIPIIITLIYIFQKVTTDRFF